MSAVPRVIFTRFARSDSPKLRPWVDHRARLLFASDIVDDANGTVVWQLVSANNREVARGANIHGDFERATAVVQAVAAASAELLVVPVSEQARGVFGWYATIGDVPAMMCARWFQSDRDRWQSVRLALHGIGLADVSIGSRLSDPALMTGA